MKRKEKLTDKHLKVNLLRDSLNLLRDFAFQEAKAKGFHSSDQEKIGDHCANLHGEVSELWEAWRKGKLNEPCDKAPDMEKHGLTVLTCGEEEIADIIIRALDTAAAFNIDVEKAVRAKFEFNRTRPHRNGGKLA